MPLLHQGTTHIRGLTDALNYFCHFAINVNLQQECVAGQAGMEHFSHLILRHNTMISGTISRLPWRHWPLTVGSICDRIQWRKCMFASRRIEAPEQFPGHDNWMLLGNGLVIEDVSNSSLCLVNWEFGVMNQDKKNYANWVRGGSDKVPMWKRGSPMPWFAVFSRRFINRTNIVWIPFPTDGWLISTYLGFLPSGWRWCARQGEEHSMLSEEGVWQDNARESINCL